MAISDGPSLTSFSPNTLIQSSQVNDNFTALVNNHLPNIVAAQTITSGGTVTLQGSNLPQYLKVVGDGSATLASSFFNTAPSAAITVTLWGQDDSNPVFLCYSDTVGGAIINGPYTELGTNDMISLLYSPTDQRYYELGRNH